MQTIPRTNRILVIALLAASALSAVAPVAEAGHAYGRRFKGVAHSAPAPRYYYSQPVIVHQHSSAGPALAGLIGGFILGAAVTSHAAPVVVSSNTCAPAPHYSYSYYDPYCGEWFASLSMAREHCAYERHPWRVQVYNGRGGECLRTMRWSDGAWYDCGRGNDWDD
jgi:hypothetical protein